MGPAASATPLGLRSPPQALPLRCLTSTAPHWSAQLPGRRPIRLTLLDLQADAVLVAVTRPAELRAGLDIVVNCAGRGTPGTRLEDESPDTWRALIDLNLLGTNYVCRAALPHLVNRGSGRIINIASDAGRTGSAGEAVYSAAKGGVIALTRSLAREFAR